MRYVHHNGCLSRGGGVLPSSRLMGMSRWMGLHFHDWIDCNGAAFSSELPEWDGTYRIYSNKRPTSN